MSQTQMTADALGHAEALLGDNVSVSVCAPLKHISPLSSDVYWI